MIVFMSVLSLVPFATLALGLTIASPMPQDNGHRGSGDPFGDDAKKPFVIRGMAEITGGQVRSAGAAFTVNAMATGTLGAIKCIAAGTVIGRLERVLECGVAMLGG